LALRISEHAKRRMAERHIDLDEIEQVLAEQETTSTNYQDRGRPAVVVLGQADDRRLKVVISEADPEFVITVADRRRIGSGKMLITYDTEARATYLALRDAPVASTVSTPDPLVNVDLDQEGEPVGVEIDLPPNAKAFWSARKGLARQFPELRDVVARAFVRAW
jgi:uncharacterized protein YuzE